MNNHLQVLALVGGIVAFVFWFKLAFLGEGGWWGRLAAIIVAVAFFAGGEVYGYNELQSVGGVVAALFVVAIIPAALISNLLGYSKWPIYR